MNFNTKLRTLSMFSGLLSQLIESAMTMKNSNASVDSISEALLVQAREELKLVETSSIFSAACKLVPMSSIPSDFVENGNSILDLLTESVATIVVNDAMIFTGAGVAIEESADATSPIYQVQLKKQRKVNTAVAVGDNIDDALRDELSGKGVVSGADDNSCMGGACTI